MLSFIKMCFSCHEAEPNAKKDICLEELLNDKQIAKDKNDRQSISDKPSPKSVKSAKSVKEQKPDVASSVENTNINNELNVKTTVKEETKEESTLLALNNAENCERKKMTVDFRRNKQAKQLSKIQLDPKVSARNLLKEMRTELMKDLF